jgi:transposase
MNVIHYIGLDVHKKTISYCIKTAAGQIVKEGTLAAEKRRTDGIDTNEMR